MNEKITLGQPTPARILGVAVTIAAGQRLVRGPERRREGARIVTCWVENASRGGPAALAPFEIDATHLELHDEVDMFTVFAIYEETLQPYCTSVEAESAGAAVVLAQEQCVADNDPAGSGDYPEPDAWDGTPKALGDFGDYTLAAFQVVRGGVEVIL